MNRCNQGYCTWSYSICVFCCLWAAGNDCVFQQLTASTVCAYVCMSGGDVEISRYFYPMFLLLQSHPFTYPIQCSTCATSDLSIQSILISYLVHILEKLACSWPSLRAFLGNHISTVFQHTGTVSFLQSPHNTHCVGLQASIPPCPCHEQQGNSL